MKSRSEKRERGWLDRVNWESGLGVMLESHRKKLRGDGDGEK